ncbi:mitochondrial protein-like protein Fmp25 [Pleomassaria siparia CBS 279.74]|uniref:Mitochondrial protein-like protein Fmp25 n=1 Tax=Pleomassaria siparia CBS 279.74 TaxID=1314801 RepID=A0A6G1JQV5_9PLEO|nr:mitochondrial protein-like protein Fmp25 [Pleomassaria siparia CBS 279.74]
MLNTRCLSRATTRVASTPTPRLCRHIAGKARSQAWTAAHPYAQRRQQHFFRSVMTVTVLAATATVWQWTQDKPIFREVHAEEPPSIPEPELEFEKPRRPPTDEEDNRAIISSQHLQVKKSWENPGVYAWGSNSGRVVSPNSTDTFVKTPRRIPFFDGVLLRDIKMDRNFAAAIDERGDLLQWGSDFSKETTQPTRTLKGKNLISLALSRDRIVALSAKGDVYSIPVSQAEQLAGPKPTNTSWIPFWGSSANNISYRVRTPQNLGWNERVTEISGGLEHALMLTSSGRVYSFASGTQDFPTRGQLGVPGLTWGTRPDGVPFDVPHEITTLNGFPITKIATGDYHSLVSDAAGRAFAFGDNSAGQLGFEFNAEAVHVDAPSLLPTQRLYAGTGRQASVTNVFAGGNSSFLTIEAAKPSSAARENDRVTADTWAFGFGLTGQLGTGRWIHNQSTPTRVPAFSSLFEYDEDTSSVMPIRLAYLSVGASHAAAVMDNIASVSVLGKSRKLTENDTNWGRDILFWGNNEFYQIGSGKRNNVSTPTYLQPLDQAAEAERASGVLGWGRQKIEKEMHRFQITPKQKVKVKGRWVDLEQRVECGRGVTAVYSGV